jgi:two-component system, response regulator YesN
MAYNILIVDDEVAITSGLAYDIDWSQIDVLEVFKANNVPAALDYLQNNKIDVVITDIRMPEMDGLELAASIQKQWRFARTIFISGYDEFEYAKKAIDLGVFCYMTKPIANERLLETVRRALQAIEAELDNTRLISAARQAREALLPAIRERALNAWIARGRAMPGRDTLENAGVSLGEDVFLALVTMDDPGSDAMEPGFGYETTLPGMIDSILFDGHGQSVYFTDGDENIVIVASGSDRGGLEDALRFMKGMAEPFQSTVYRTLGYTVSLFFGSIVPLGEAHGEYLRLLDQSNMRLSGKPGVIMVPEPPTESGLTANRANRLAEQVRSYVEQNINMEITVADIAAHLHLHPNYLLRLFKEETGQAVIDYLISVRLQKAKQLLSTTDMKIYEVAGCVGYDSVSHFSRIFKRETGLSPKDFQLRA